MINLDLPTLDAQIVKRSRSFFAQDIEANQSALASLIKGSRVLVIGGAGSIGFQTLKVICAFGPSTVHVVDQNENGLAEVVRALRSATEALDVDDFLTMPFDFGGAPFQQWLASQKQPYDFVLNFAAMKHVRSEKDPYSVLAMLETNVVKLVDLAERLHRIGQPKRLFCVSTDKAANPSSMMGATKRLMEHALFSPGQTWEDETQITSARFANVAMSNGSLPQSWQYRLAARQPMACPEGCKRYFVTLNESGHLCALAGFFGHHRHLIVPDMPPEDHLVLLQDVAARFLETQGLTAWFTRDEEEAKGKVAELASQHQWPVLLTPLDTAGEKPYEEFVGVGERQSKSGFSSLNQIEYLPPKDPTAFSKLMIEVRKMLEGGESSQLDELTLKNAIASVEPAFAESHRSSSKNLDARA